jgi:pimeloyl-ACP methyl ester carboxylesterase
MAKIVHKKIFKFLGSKLCFEVLGRGKPVVLLHGGLTKWNGHRFKHLLAKNFKIFIPEMPGFGTSEIIKDKKHNTDLFTQSLAVFLNNYNLKQAPIIALSLGCIVALKAALMGVTEANLVLAGLPIKVNGWRYQLTQLLPLALQKIIIKTRWGGRQVLLPMLKESIGGEPKKGNGRKLLKLVERTHLKSIVEINYKKEIEKDMPQLLTQVKNKKVFIYGEFDPQKKWAKKLLGSYRVVPLATHNIFKSQPKKTLALIKKLI